MKDSILKTDVSIYRNGFDSTSTHTVSLLTWLQSKKHLTAQDKVRKIADKKERNNLKAEILPMITPSGIFSGRNQNSLIKHSGFIALDIDRDSFNEGIRNWTEIPQELAKLNNIAYVGKSVSGKGYWALIPIAFPDKHKAHFKALEAIFLRMGLKLDSAPSNVVSARFYAYDKEAYFNHYATPFTGLLEEESPKPAARPKHHSQSDNGWLLDWLLKEMRNAPFGERHATRLRLGRLTGGYIAGGLLPTDAAETLVSAYINDYGSKAERKEIKAIRDGIKNGMKTPIYEVSNLKPYKAFNPSRLPLPQRNPIMSPRAQEAPLKRFDTLSRDGETWEVEINEHGYPSLWDS